MDSKGRSVSRKFASMVARSDRSTYFCSTLHNWQEGSSCSVFASGVYRPYRLFMGMWMPWTSNASAMRQATMAVDRLYILRTIRTTCFANLLLGFNHALIAGDAVLSRFQSNLVKSIFLVIGACGGAAKLNHTARSSMTQEDVLSWLSSGAWVPVTAPLLPFPVTPLAQVLSTAGFAADEAALFCAWLTPEALLVAVCSSNSSRDLTVSAWLASASGSSFFVSLLFSPFSNWDLLTTFSNIPSSPHSNMMIPSFSSTPLPSLFGGLPVRRTPLSVDWAGCCAPKSTPRTGDVTLAQVKNTRE